MIKVLGRVACQNDGKMFRVFERDGKESTYQISVLIAGTKDFADCYLAKDMIPQLGSLKEFDLLEVTSTGGVSGSQYGVKFKNCTFKPYKNA